MAFLHRTRSFKGYDIQLPTSTETAQELKTVVDKVGNSLRDTFADMNVSIAKKNKKSRAWNVKANTAKTCIVGYYNVTFTLLAIACGVFSTYALESIRLQISVWLIASAVIIPFDVLHFFDRFLAIQSRIATGLALLAVSIFIMTGFEAALKIAIITITTAIFLIAVLNNKWLAAEQWLLTDAGQKALQLDLENSATRAWQGFGRRETRSMLCALGIESTDDALDIVHRPIWLSGFLQSEYKVAHYEAQAEKVNALKALVKKQKEEIENINADFDSSFTQIRDLKYELHDVQNQYSELCKEYDELNKCYSNLVAENEELTRSLEKCQREKAETKEIEENTAVTENADINSNVVEVPTHDDVVVTLETHEQTELEQLLDLIEQGYSQSKAGEMLGMSKAKASRIIKNARENGEIPEGHPALKIRPAVAAARV